MEQIKEIGWKNNQPISFTAQTDFVSRSQSPLLLTHTPSLCVNYQDMSTTVLVQPTSEVLPLLDQNQNPVTKQNTISIDNVYVTDKLPGSTASHDLEYKTNFGDDMVPFSVEETRRNVKPIAKEHDVDTIIKAAPSSKFNVNESHRSLPRRACLVHLKEQYHLAHDLLSQPRATKYLLKVRTEISPGRYMTKMELHCSR